MSNENMMIINLDNFDLDCSIEVPTGMFFELFQVMPTLIEQFGYENSRQEYHALLEGVQHEFNDIKNFSWDAANQQEQSFLRRCQVVAMLGAHLDGFPLLLGGDDLVKRFSAEGGIQITEEEFHAPN